MKHSFVIGFVWTHNPFTDRKTWSGTMFKLREAIEQAGYEVRWIPYKSSVGVLLRRLYLRFKSLIKGKSFFQGFHDPFSARQYAKSIAPDLINSCDCLFFPGGAQIALFLNTKIPVIYCTDATVQGMINYYWSGYDQESIKKAEEMESKAANLCAINIRSSQWAIDSVIRDCKADPSTCFVLEFGANIDKKDIVPVEPYNGGQFNILFSGVDWERKGGDIAVETVRLLREMNIDAHLIVAGPKTMPIKNCEQFVEFVGFLDKNDEGDYKRYVELFRRSNIFLLPTKAECSAIVFCEAAAFGLPCYTYNTGGTANYVINSVNGYALLEGSPAQDFAEQIYHDICSNNLCVLRDGALRLSNERLSWESWSKDFRRIIESVFFNV